MMAFCPVTLFDTTNDRTCSATSSTVANRFNLFASLTASNRAGGKESPQSYQTNKLVASTIPKIELDEVGAYC
jgi:hypothetical protein